MIRAGLNISVTGHRMKSLSIDKFIGTVSIVSNFFAKPDECLKIIGPDDMIVCLGGIVHDRAGSIDLVKSISRDRKIHYILDQRDIRFIKNEWSRPENFETIAWLERQPVSAELLFASFSKWAFCCGGIDPEWKSWETVSS